MTRARAAVHALAHALGINAGEVISTSSVGGRTFVAFRCGGCGHVSGIEETTDLYERTMAARRRAARDAAGGGQ